MAEQERFLGVHFDFHAAEDCTEVGRRTTPDRIQRIIDKVKPDFLQCDAKGHPGYASYPTLVGQRAPGIVGDPLRVWREVTKRNGVDLYVHFSGVMDMAACRAHPEWARIDESGSPDSANTSTFGPYADESLIPQIKELAGEYGLDGIWIDGECWAAQPDYNPAVLEEFRRETGAAEGTAADEAERQLFAEFGRRRFRSYLSHYVDEVHRAYPGFRIASNWAFTSFMPEPVSAGVDFLSGDYSPQDSLNTARLEGRCLVHQGKPWDLMAWGFVAQTEAGDNTNKSAVQLMQEASAVLSLGGGFQTYYQQNRDGSVNDWEMDIMARVADFCRARRPWCYRSEPIPQIALFYSTEGFYGRSRRLFSHWDGQLNGLKGVLQCLLDSQYVVDVTMTHQLEARLHEYPLVVLPEWETIEAHMKERLLDYVASGGNLLIVGSRAAKPFELELGVKLGGEPRTDKAYLAHDGKLAMLNAEYADVRVPDGAAEAIGRLYPGKDPEAEFAVPASWTPYGKGKLAAVYFQLGERYASAASAVIRDFVASLVELVFPEPLIRVSGSRLVDVAASRKDGRVIVHLVNTGGPHGNGKVLDYDEIPPLGPLSVSIRTDKRPVSMSLEPSGQPLDFQYEDGRANVRIERLAIYDMIVVTE